MFKINGQNVSVNIDHRLSPKQLYIFNRLSNVSDRLAYLQSLTGVKSRLYNVSAIRKGLARHGGFDSLMRPKGHFLTLQNNLYSTQLDFKPSHDSKGRWIGVEIECFIPAPDGSISDYNQQNSDIRQALRDAKVKRCSVKSDGSLHDDNGTASAKEFTLLFDTTQGFDQLQGLCKVLNQFGAYVNKTCGLHVHFDQRGASKKDIRRVGNRFAKALPILTRMMPESRRDNHYCRNRVSSVRHGSCRYFALNLTSFYRHKTVECRLHNGSTNFAKIRNWIDLVGRILSTPNGATLNTFQDFIDVLNLPDYLVEYCEGRLTDHSPDFLTLPVALVPAPIEVTQNESVQYDAQAAAAIVSINESLAETFPTAQNQPSLDDTIPEEIIRAS